MTPRKGDFHDWKLQATGVGRTFLEKLLLERSFSRVSMTKGINNRVFYPV